MASPFPVVGVLGPMQRRLAAVVLAGQAPVIVFGALTLWGLASAQGHSHAGPVLTVGCLAALLAVLAAGLLRRPFGVTLGWVVQLVTLAAAVLEPLSLLAGVIFLALWVTALVQGRKMDALTAAHRRTHAAG